MKILEDLLPKHELELWIKYKKIMDNEKLENERDSKESGSDESEIEEDSNLKKKKVMRIPSFGKKLSNKKSTKTSKLSTKKDHALYLKEKVSLRIACCLILISHDEH